MGFFAAPRETLPALFLPPGEGLLPAFRAALAAFLAAFGPFAAFVPAFRPALRGIFRVREAPRLGEPAFLEPPSTAPMASRMRLMSRVTCSMVIMPSTVTSLRRSE